MSDKDFLKVLVDGYGIDGVMNMLSDICFEKAEHIKSAWQVSSNVLEVREWEDRGKWLAVPRRNK